ncbi:hypothetical protein DFH08DRAFT_963626 [Mycena albidolilacea]|uniref:Uncharacterized protein n=1 Tax=Mycena albidolilacea TaxID=1033008 RepID=A0AAD6ZUY6_9AGAR|nr:hypothetical protein DFH08DRAFT_963626 [Mycena albidolilacea]
MEAGRMVHCGQRSAVATLVGGSDSATAKDKDDTAKKDRDVDQKLYVDMLLAVHEKNMAMVARPSLDMYAWETMSESLEPASICSITLHQLDEALYSRLLLLLNDQSPICDTLVQEATLKATIVLMHKYIHAMPFSFPFLNIPSFPDVARTMASHLRCFVTPPLPIFEF